MKYRIVTLIILLLLSACQSATSIKSVDSNVDIQHVCIENNANVKAHDFLQIVRDGFDRNGVSTEVYTSAPPASCQYKVTYNAATRWELIYGVFLAHANIRIEKDGRYVASGTYDYSSGFSAAKSRSARENIDPIIDKMLN